MRRMLIVVIACSVLIGCAEKRIVPSLRALPTASPEDFVGSWEGTAVDRPNEGSERMTMSLVVAKPEGASWSGAVSGSVVGGQERKVELALRGNKLAFRLPSKGWKVDVWLGVASKAKDTLLGVALPVPTTGWEEGEDSFSIRLKKTTKEAQP